MTIIYNEADKDEIENIIKSDEFCVFKSEMEEKLNIQDIQYEIEVQDVAYNEGYVEQSVNARTKFNNGYNEIEKVIFFTESIKEEVNRKFFKLSTNRVVFNKVTDIYIKVIFLHELVHIQQFKNNRLTQDVIEKEKELSYKNRPLEIEAISISKQIIGGYGRFEYEIAKYINSNLSINNDNITEIFNLFSDFTGSDKNDR